MSPLSRYGKEDDHFVMELVYNYIISTYSLGNNFQVIWRLTHNFMNSFS
jgi:hypothetical protein